MNFSRLTGIFCDAAGNILRRLCVYCFRTIMRILPRNYFAKKIMENSKRYIGEKTKRVGEFTAYEHGLIDRKIFSSFTELEFEGKMYKAPSGYDELLTSHYGDYMTPPPPEERILPPPFTAYIKD